MKNIIIFGPPGTGKGTMSEKVAKEFGFKHISTGDIIRKNQEEKTKIGILADKVVNQGNLLPDNIVNEMIKQEIIDNSNASGLIFDGYPRTTDQAKTLDQFLNKRKAPVSKVILLDADKYVIKNRILERGRESGRKDDNAEVFETRWSAYQKETIPALNYFEGRGMVVKVDSEKSIESVYDEVKSIINAL